MITAQQLQTIHDLEEMLAQKIMTAQEVHEEAIKIKPDNDNFGKLTTASNIDAISSKEAQNQIDDLNKDKLKLLKERRILEKKVILLSGVSRVNF